jgi:hypothetical protein
MVKRRTGGKMTTGLKTPSSYYIEMIVTFPPRPITCEAELIATQNRIDSIFPLWQFLSIISCKHSGMSNVL